jgi:hypothetical protein
MMMSMRPTNDVAGPGEVFVCAACGRRSKDRNGDQKIHSGWDTSCRTWAVKCREQDLIIAPKSGIVTGLKDGTGSDDDLPAYHLVTVHAAE